MPGLATVSRSAAWRPRGVVGDAPARIRDDPRARRVRSPAALDGSGWRTAGSRRGRRGDGVGACSIRARTSSPWRRASSARAARCAARRRSRARTHGGPTRSSVLHDVVRAPALMYPPRSLVEAARHDDHGRVGASSSAMRSASAASERGQRVVHQDDVGRRSAAPPGTPLGIDAARRPVIPRRRSSRRQRRVVRDVLSIRTRTSPGIVSARLLVQEQPVQPDVGDGRANASSPRA